MESIIEIFTDIGRQFLMGIPNLVKALLILFVGWIVAKIVSKAVKKMLKAIKIDSLGEKLNEIEMVSKSNINIDLSSIFAKVVYYIFMLFVLVASSEALGMPAVSKLVSDIFNFVPNLIVALIVMILGLVVAEAIKKLVKTTLTSLGIPSANLISNFLFYFLFLNVVISAMSQAKINTAFLSQNITMVIGGIVLAFGIGYGLASKDIVANFLASFYSKDRFEIGDKVTLGDLTGEIIDIDRSSLTLSAENGRIIIPMSKITTENITIHN